MKVRGLAGLALAFVLVLCCTPALAQQSALARADAAYGQGDLAAALPLYEQALADDPGLAEAWLTLGRIHGAQQEWDAAVEAYARLAELDSMAPEVRTEFGDALRESGDLARAIVQYNLALKDGAIDSKSDRLDKTAERAPSITKQDKTNSADKPVSDKPASGNSKASKPDTSTVSSMRNTDTDKGFRSADAGESVAPSAPAYDKSAPAGSFSVPRAQPLPGPDLNTVQVLRTQDTSALREVPLQDMLQVPPPDGGGTSMPEAGDLLSAARAHAAAKDWTQAVEAYRMLIAQGNTDLGVRLEYADALRQAGTLGEAEAEYNRVLHDDAANVEAKIGLSKVLAQSGRIDEAMYLLDQLETEPTAMRRARLARVYAYFINGYVEEAWRDIGDLVAREPQNKPALDLIQQQADWKDIRAALAGVAGNEELLALADEIIDAERTLALTEPSDQRTRAEWLFQQGQYDKSRTDFEALIRQDPSDSRAWLRLGMMYFWSGDWAASVEAYDHYLELAPDDAAARLERARAVLYGGNCNEARDEAWSLIIDNTTPVEVYEQTLIVYAVALNACGQKTEALHWFEEALVFQPRNTEALVAYGQALAGTKDYDKAIKIFQTALQEDPASDPARIGLAQAYSWKGDQKQAIANYGQVSQGGRYYQASLIGQSYSYLWQGERNRALQLASQAGKLNPDNPEMEALMARLNGVADPALTASYLQSHDSEDNDTRLVSTRVTVPLSAAGAQLAVQYDDLKLDNTLQGQATAGSNTRLALDLPLGSNSAVHAEASKLDLSNGHDGKVNVWNWGASFHHVFNEDFGAGVAYRSNLLYDTPQLVREEVRVGEWEVNADWRVIDDRTRLYATYSRGKLSDYNKRLGFGLDLRRTATYSGRGRLNYGASLRGVDYQRDLDHGYWDPNNYRIYEVYADWLDLSARRLALEGGAAIGIDTAAGLDPRFVWRYNAALRWRVKADGMTMRLGYSDSKGSDTAATGPGYEHKWWYLAMEYMF